MGPTVESAPLGHGGTEGFIAHSEMVADNETIQSNLMRSALLGVNSNVVRGMLECG